MFAGRLTDRGVGGSRRSPGLQRLDDPIELGVAGHIAQLVHERFGVTLSEAEIEALYSVIAVRAVRGTRQDAAEQD